MKISIITFFIGLTTFAQSKYQKDFTTYWTTVDSYFAYFDSQKVDWQKAKTIYQPIIDTISNTADFIKVLEKANNELHNGHISLNTNLPSSHRLIPTGTDIWVSYKDKKFFVSNLREGFSAEKSGIKPGMQITSFNGVPFEKIVAQYLPKATEKHTKSMYEYVANMIIAATHDTDRVLKVNDSLTFNLDKVKNLESGSFIETKMLSDAIGYIKFNNSLGEEGTVAAFDKAMLGMKNTKGLIVDLRETPSGGNTTIARAIMGRFIDEEKPYQRHSFTYEEKLYGVKRNTIELVAPRGEVYSKPLIVLCGRWTGSMGEGMVIGFDAMGRAGIVGTKMAGLLGAIYSYTLPETKIGYQIPVEKLFHVNGTPRENFRPKHYILDPKEQLQKAIERIQISL
ncbi:S41 family peptidase [Aquimarina sediminis]|uniref:S41 family peptidase n=1 Tax=Aquimarina sediminis TaxID=2070536 RepID=UPI000FFE7798|nr:S41 family peptidase [Aquimarina sediminis]